METPNELIQSLMRQILQGLAYLHGVSLRRISSWYLTRWRIQRQVVHRDLKPANLLVSKAGDLKIADLGSARKLPSPASALVMTNLVVSMWYRAPELLMGEEEYGPEVDIWSVG